MDYESVFPYMLGLLCFLATWMLRTIMEQIVEIKTWLKELSRDLRGGISKLDRRQDDHEVRIVKLESQIEVCKQNCVK